MGTYRDRNEALLIRRLPKDVARRGVPAHQNREPQRITTTGGPATDLSRGPPDHLRVMVCPSVSISLCRGIEVAAVIIILFGDPSPPVHRLSVIRRADDPCNVFTIVSEGSAASRVGELAHRRQMVNLSPLGYNITAPA